MAAPPRAPNARPENQPWVTLPVAAGTVLLFESWLRHEVPPNPVHAERVEHQLQFQLVLKVVERARSYRRAEEGT